MSQLFLSGEETTTQLRREPLPEQAVLLLSGDALETLHLWHLGYDVAGVEAVRWP